MRLIFDGHLDLALFALAYNRDQTESAATINQREAGMTDVPERGGAAVGLPDMRRGGVAVCQSTVAVRADSAVRPLAGYRRIDLDFATQAMAYAYARGQLAYYQVLEQQGEIALISTSGELEAHWRRWEEDKGETKPVGIIVSMECADPIVEPNQAEDWWKCGVRSVSLAHFGKSHYAHGTGVSGGLTDKGVELLGEFEKVGMVLDLTHTADEGFYQALDCFGGPVLASHTNCRALVPGDRQFSDAQIELLIQRDAVIGAALDAWMLMPGFVVGETEPGDLSIAAVADHIDRVCQLAGDARHAAIGSDTGGTNHMPSDYRTIADLQKLGTVLEQLGYDAADIDAIFHGNWLRFFGQWLPH